MIDNRVESEKSPAEFNNVRVTYRGGVTRQFMRIVRHPNKQSPYMGVRAVEATFDDGEPCIRFDYVTIPRENVLDIQSPQATDYDLSEEVGRVWVHFSQADPLSSRGEEELDDVCRVIEGTLGRAKREERLRNAREGVQRGNRLGPTE